MSSQDDTTNAIEAHVFRRLLQHLDNNKNVQNIDLMILSGFCRNCLSKWYMAAAEEQGVAIDYDQARERIYGMPYDQYKAQYQIPASEEQQRAFAEQQKNT